MEDREVIQDNQHVFQHVIGWMASSRCSGQQLNVQMEISDEWCSLGVCIGSSTV